jgi:hypothetical protein
MKFEFYRHIFEKSSNKIFIKSHPVTADLFHVDGQAHGWTVGQTDITKLIIALRNACRRAYKLVHSEQESCSQLPTLKKTDILYIMLRKLARDYQGFGGTRCPIFHCPTLAHFNTKVPPKH